jgi:hypothetical protein
MLDAPELKQSGIIKEVHWDIYSVKNLLEASSDNDLECRGNVLK